MRAYQDKNPTADAGSARTFEADFVSSFYSGQLSDLTIRPNSEKDVAALRAIVELGEHMKSLVGARLIRDGAQTEFTHENPAGPVVD